MTDDILRRLSHLEGSLKSISNDNNSSATAIFRRLADAEKGQAVIANELEHIRKDLNNFFGVVRSHMDREDDTLAKLTTRVSTTESALASMKSFGAGLVSATSVFWVVLSTAGFAIYKWLSK